MQVAGERFSFRWGIPWLDRGYMIVPNFFFRHYVEVGVTRPEFLFVLHLAAYRFESERGVARPSLRKVAEEMGYKKRQVQRIVKTLKDKKWLVVTERPGKASEYNFEALARALLRASERDNGNDGGVTHDTGRGVTHDMGRGVTHDTRRRRREEEETVEKRRPSDIYAQVDREATERLVLVGYGVDMATKMVERYGGKLVLAVLDRAVEGDHLGGEGDWIRRELARCPDRGSEESEGGDDDRGTTTAA